MDDLIIYNNIFKISNYHMNEFYSIYNIILRKLKACGKSYSVYFDGIIDSKHRNRAAVLIKNTIHT